VIRAPLALPLALGLGAACAVPEVDLDHKRCPCAAGYACYEPTQQCVPTNDAGGLIDTPSTESCLPESTTQLYQYANDFVTWQHDPGGDWIGGAEITQMAASAMDTYAYHSGAQVAGKRDYRVIASMRTLADGMGTPAFGIVLRAQAGTNKSRYACFWDRKNRQLQLLASHGGSLTVLPNGATATIAEPLMGSFTMEARVSGTAPPTLSCCIRELAMARLAGITDADAGAVTEGFPGLGTDRTSSAFSSFLVFEP
jgi:hypothetical protein